MTGKLLELLGVVRALVMLVTLVAVGIALNRAGVPAVPLGVVIGLMVLVFLYAPFGAKYRRW